MVSTIGAESSGKETYWRTSPRKQTYLVDHRSIPFTESSADCIVAAAMHALRLGAFLSRPTLLAIETLVMIGPYLTNSGKLLDAWTLFGTTIRLAQAIGCKCTTLSEEIREANGRSAS